jgi:hypothetical protein
MSGHNEGFKCAACEDSAPHHHDWIYPAEGPAVEAVVYHSDAHPRAEVRDSETGEVIFPAVKGPLRVVEGGAA